MGRRSVLLLVAPFAGVATAAAAGAALDRNSAPPPPPAFVVAAARREASALGYPHPTSGVYVLTRHRAATRASSGGTVNSNQPVYLIVLTGRFITGQVGPYPGRRVRGTVASEVLDAQSGRDTDFSIGPRPISLARLGPIGNLLPYLDGSKLPACGVPDLHGSADFQGATGSQLGGLQITNIGRLACTLPGRAAISMRWHGLRLPVARTSFPPAGSPA